MEWAQSQAISSTVSHDEPVPLQLGSNTSVGRDDEQETTGDRTLHAGDWKIRNVFQENNSLELELVPEQKRSIL